MRIILFGIGTIGAVSQARSAFLRVSFDEPPGARRVRCAGGVRPP